MASLMTDEFDRQVDVLNDKGYPRKAGVSRAVFDETTTRLRKLVEKLKSKSVDIEKGRIPFVLVTVNSKLNAKWKMSRVSRLGKKGHVAMKPTRPEEFKVLDGIKIPNAEMYLLVDVDRGADTLNVTPETAFKMIKRRRRSPLTIDEGLAVITQFPDFLQKNNCFSLLASRQPGQKVPAIWIDGEKRPKLGWCWDRNPHTWLGSASCRQRIAVGP
ncbi:MAG TPA: DUF5701 family protein [Kiritimatiellia bacterium]|nr:DUF5701 family protein [Kiritimatiellia bacterium]